jgi:hypothetical protein
MSTVQGIIHLNMFGPSVCASVAGLRRVVCVSEFLIACIIRVYAVPALQ